MGESDEVSLVEDQSAAGDTKRNQEAHPDSEDDESSASSSSSSSSNKKSSSSSSSTSKQSLSGQASDSSTDKSNSSNDPSIEEITPTDPRLIKQGTKKVKRVSTITRKNLEAAERARTYMLDSDEESCDV